VYGWTFKELLEVKVSQRFRQRVNCFGAVNTTKGEVIQMASKESKAPAFVRFLRKIDKKYRHAAIIIYLDNLLVHKSANVGKFLGRHTNIRLEFLPPYSPEMNLQEEWWNYERCKFLNNRNFRSTHQLATSMNWFTKKTPPEQVMSVCSFASLERLLQ
jgi:transposase